MKKYIVKSRLNKILDERKMSQLELAKMTGIGTSSISRFDKNNQHRDEHIVVIMKVLNIKYDELFEIIEVEE